MPVLETVLAGDDVIDLWARARPGSEAWRVEIRDADGTRTELACGRSDDYRRATHRAECREAGRGQQAAPAQSHAGNCRGIDHDRTPLGVSGRKPRASGSLHRSLRRPAERSCRQWMVHAGVIDPMLSGCGNLAWTRSAVCKRAR